MKDALPSGKTLILILISASLAAFMSSLDGTIVNIALPSIAEAFSLTTSSVAWVSTIYLLVIAGLLLIVGKLTDTIGLKKIFLAGFSIFVIGSFSCGFFPELLNSFHILLISRIVQAIGGVMMMVVAPAMLSRFMPGERRAKGLSLVMLFAAVGMALGPTLGGYLTEYLSWNWIFYINVPVGIIAVVLGLFVIPKTEAKSCSLKKFDTAGAVLIFVGLAALLFAFSEGFSLGWTSALIIISLLLAVFCIGGFIFRERHYENPLIDLGMFKSRSFVIVNMILALLFFTFAGANYMLPFYLEVRARIFDLERRTDPDDDVGRDDGHRSCFRADLLQTCWKDQVYGHGRSRSDRLRILSAHASEPSHRIRRHHHRTFADRSRPWPYDDTTYNTDHGSRACIETGNDIRSDRTGALRPHDDRRGSLQPDFDRRDRHAHKKFRYHGDAAGTDQRVDPRTRF